MRFILPDRVPQFDFQFQLLASQDYWSNFKESPLDIVYANDYTNWKQALAHGTWEDRCPVGSLEFCKMCGIETLPRNIPPQLVQFAAGTVTNDITSRHLDGIASWHVKSAKAIKDSSNGEYSISHLPPFDDYQAVAWLPHGFESEWRVFVFSGDIVDMQNYAGDVWTLPSKNDVEKMIHDFEHAPGFNCPPAYTLDVGVSDGKTHVIEVHDFYSCGTYNFNDHYRLPMMLWEWWNWFKRYHKASAHK